MDEGMSGRILGKIGLAVLIIALADLGFLNWWVVKNDKLTGEIVSAFSNRKTESSQKQKAEANQKPAVDLESVALEPSPSPTPAARSTAKNSASSSTQTIVQNAQKEIFIPLGSGSTKSGTYAELAGMQVTIDFPKYQGIESMVFEASVWVDGGNGRGWGQLYNVDDKTLLIESQISSVSSSGSLQTSGKVPVPGAAKTYRVYAKTDLTDYAVHIENARIKITLK